MYVQHALSSATLGKLFIASVAKQIIIMYSTITSWEVNRYTEPHTVCDRAVWAGVWWRAGNRRLHRSASDRTWTEMVTKVEWGHMYRRKYVHM